MCADPKLRTRLLRELVEELAARRRDTAASAAPGDTHAQGAILKSLSLALPAVALALLAAVYF